jgi:hypothetical protein
MGKGAGAMMLLIYVCDDSRASAGRLAETFHASGMFNP